MDSNAPRGRLGPPLLIDAHVHFHACFEPARFLAAAATNFATAAAGLGLPATAQGLLLLTESAGAHFFADVRRRLRPDAGWQVVDGQESDSLLVESTVGARLLLVAGRQILTHEGVEVLALACEPELADGRPIAETLAEVRAAGGVPVLPWGFGKWWGRRGRIVELAVDRSDAGDLCLGDNRNRWSGLRRPALFERAAGQGVPMLPGTDPLPFADQVTHAGSYGGVLEESLSMTRPAAGLRELLLRPGTRIVPYGRGERLVPFARNQLRMQLRKRLRARASQ